MLKIIVKKFIFQETEFFMPEISHYAYLS